MRGPRWIWRSHLVFAVLFSAGVALRILTSYAYRPALIYPDSTFYLGYAHGPWVPGTARTTAYSILLRGLLALQGLDLVAVVQHVLGLAIAVVLYVFLVRWGCARGWAALATLPVLLDPLQVVLEHYVLTDVPAEALVVFGLVVLGWPTRRADRAECSPKARARSTVLRAGVGGLLLGLSAVTRSGEILLGGVAVVFILLLTGEKWWRRLLHAALAAVVFLAPIIAYAGWMDSTRGTFGLTQGYSGHFLYGRVMAFADCTGLDLPHSEQALCSPLPPDQRNLSLLMWRGTSPSWALIPPPGKTVDEVDGDFARRILRHQPMDYVRTVATDFAYNFAPTRGMGPERFPNWYFTYRPGYPAGVGGIQKIVDRFGGSDVAADPTLAGYLTTYGTWWTPGPLLGLLLLAGLGAVAGLGRARRSGMRLVCLLMTVGLIASLLVPAMLVGFSVRYMFVTLALAPAAGVLGLTAMLRRPPSAASADRS